MSPMTITWLPAFWNAAQAVRPSGGVIFTPAAVTARSLRGTETLKTCSFSFIDPLAPVSSSILAVFRPAARRAKATRDPLMCTSLRLGDEVVERDHRVGLGPESELAGRRERGVVLVDDLPAVEKHLDMIADVLHGQLVPRAARDLAIPVAELTAPALDHSVQANVVLERVGARDVVVVCVLEPPDEAAALVHFAGDRLAADRQPQVFHFRPGVGDAEAVVGVVAVGL